MPDVGVRRVCRGGICFYIGPELVLRKIFNKQYEKDGRLGTSDISHLALTRTPHRIPSLGGALEYKILLISSLTLIRLHELRLRTTRS
jgi:hypothetical protein